MRGVPGTHDREIANEPRSLISEQVSVEANCIKQFRAGIHGIATNLMDRVSAAAW